MRPISTSCLASQPSPKRTGRLFLTLPLLLPRAYLDFKPSRKAELYKHPIQILYGFLITLRPGGQGGRKILSS
jgi:hypothetical protein